MNALKLAVLAFASLSITASVFAEPIEFGKITSAQLTELKALSRVYANQSGDKLDVEFEVVKKDEPGLFDAEEFTINGSYEGADGESWEFNEQSLDFSRPNEIAFYASEDDCDNPGCSNYEIEFVFKKSIAGAYSAEVSMSVTVDSEDLAYLWDENEDLPKEELETLLDSACKETYGETAELYDFTGDYKGSVYCHYEKKSVLQIGKGLPN